MSLQTNEVNVFKSQNNSFKINFKKDLERLAELALHEGVILKPYQNADLPIFSQLPLELQEKLSQHLNHYTEIQSETYTENQKLDNLRSVWRTFSKFKLVAPDGFFTKVKDHDIVEIYDLSSFQLFRSFHFLNLCSYSLEEIFSTPWFELYQRDESATNECVQLLQGVLKEQLKGITECHFPHVVREIQSPLLLHNLISPRLACPLYSIDGKLAGYSFVFEPIKKWSSLSTNLQDC